MGPVFCSERFRDGRPKRDEGKCQRKASRFGRSIVPLAKRDAGPSHVLLFMSECPRGVFDFLLSSGPAIVFSVSYKPGPSPRAVLFSQGVLLHVLRCTACNTSAEAKMMKNGSLAVAIVHRQVVVVKGEHPNPNFASVRSADPSLPSRPFTHETRPLARRLHLYSHWGPALHRLGLPERQDPHFRYPLHLPIRVHPHGVDHAAIDHPHLLRFLRNIDRGRHPDPRVNHSRDARAPFRRVRRVPAALFSQSEAMRQTLGQRPVLESRPQGQEHVPALPLNAKPYSRRIFLFKLYPFPHRFLAVIYPTSD